jgi:hypothetical protein
MVTFPFLILLRPYALFVVGTIFILHQFPSIRHFPGHILTVNFNLFQMKKKKKKKKKKKILGTPALLCSGNVTDPGRQQNTCPHPQLQNHAQNKFMS